MYFSCSTTRLFTGVEPNYLLQQYQSIYWSRTRLFTAVKLINVVYLVKHTNLLGAVIQRLKLLKIVKLLNDE